MGVARSALSRLNFVSNWGKIRNQAKCYFNNALMFDYSQYIIWMLLFYDTDRIVI